MLHEDVRHIFANLGARKKSKHNLIMKERKRMKKLFVFLLIAAMAVAVIQAGAGTIDPPNQKKVIIRYKAGVSSQNVVDLEALGVDVKYVYKIINGIAATVDEELLDELELLENVLEIEEDYEVSICKTPNDPRFSDLWGLHNTGQTGGTYDADIDAPEAWDLQTGSSNVVVAVIDTGVDYNHQDLSANMWKNPGEVAGNGIDDDGNGYVDDVYGWDFCNNDSNPIDDHNHGTHCSGTIAGVGNNGIGVVGVNWKAKIMALKFLNSQGSGAISDALAALEYATMMKQQKNIPIIATSNSWGGGGFSSSFKQAIEASDNAGILFIAAAGNASSNNDVTPNYPSNYDVPNVIAVAATTHTDGLASFSNYGASTVDLGAPGSNILSTTRNNGYGTMSGTSMATPHVSGVAALIKAHASSYTHSQIKSLILNKVDPVSSLSGKTVTGGRLNVYNAIKDIGPGPVDPPVADFVANKTSIGVGESVIFTDQSSNNPTSWSWDFPGGTPSSSTQQNPTVTYNTVGTYDVTLTASNSAGSDTETKPGYITVSEGGPVPYCDSNGNSQSYEWIARVAVGSFSNSSGASGYSDFTSMVIDLTAGSTASVSLTPGFNWFSYREYWRMWIDYNKDGDFEDAGELVFEGNSRSTLTGSITVPSSASGQTRMRVSMRYGSPPPVCGSFDYGEVEDYTVNFR